MDDLIELFKTGKSESNSQVRDSILFTVFESLQNCQSISSGSIVNNTLDLLEPSFVDLLLKLEKFQVIFKEITKKFSSAFVPSLGNISCANPKTANELLESVKLENRKITVFYQKFISAFTPLYFYDTSFEFRNIISDITNFLLSLLLTLKDNKHETLIPISKLLIQNFISILNENGSRICYKNMQINYNFEIGKKYLPALHDYFKLIRNFTSRLFDIYPQKVEEMLINCLLTNAKSIDVKMNIFQMIPAILPLQISPSNNMIFCASLLFIKLLDSFENGLILKFLHFGGEFTHNMRINLHLLRDMNILVLIFDKIANFIFESKHYEKWLNLTVNIRYALMLLFVDIFFQVPGILQNSKYFNTKSYKQINSFVFVNNLLYSKIVPFKKYVQYSAAFISYYTIKELTTNLPYERALQIRDAASNLKNKRELLFNCTKISATWNKTTEEWWKIMSVKPPKNSFYFHQLVTSKYLFMAASYIKKSVETEETIIEKEDRIFVLFPPFVSKWMILTLEYFKNNNSNNLKEAYGIVLDTLKSIDDGVSFLNLERHNQIVNDLFLCAGLPWIYFLKQIMGQDALTKSEGLLKSHIVKMVLSRKITDMENMKPRCLDLLRNLQIFRNKFHLIFEQVFLREFHANLTEVKPTNLEILKSLSSFTHLSFCISPESIFKYLQKLIKMQIVQEDDKTMALIAEIIVKLPCIICADSKNLPLSPHPHCKICERGAVKAEEQKNFLSFKNITILSTFAALILRTKPLKAKLTLVDLLDTIKNHSEIKLNETLITTFIRHLNSEDFDVREAIANKLTKLLNEEMPDILHFSQNSANINLNKVNEFAVKIVEALDENFKNCSTFFQLRKLINLLSAFSSCTHDGLAMGILCIVIKIVYSGTYNVNLCTMCQNLFVQMAKTAKLRRVELITNFNMPLSQAIVQLSVKKFASSSEERQTQRVFNFLSLFYKRLEEVAGFTTSGLFFHYFSPNLVASLIYDMRLSERIKRISGDLLKFYSIYSNKPIEEILVTSFPTVYTHLLVKLNSSLEAINIINMIPQFVKLKDNYLLQCPFHPILIELVTYFNQDPSPLSTRIFENINFLNKWNNIIKIRPNNLPTSPSYLRVQKSVTCEVLGENIIEILASITSRVQSRFESVKMKRQLMLALYHLINYIGSNVPTHISKRNIKIFYYLNLMNAVGMPIIDLLFNVWKAFIQYLDTESLKEIFLDTTSAILSIREFFPRQIDELITILINNLNNVQDFVIKSIYLPYLIKENCPSYENVKKTFSMLKLGQIVYYIKHLVDETLKYNKATKILNFKTFFDFIQDSKCILFLKMGENKGYFDLVMRLCCIILNQIREDDLDLKIIGCKILGSIGPLNPFKFEYIKKANKCQPVINNIFAFTFLSKLLIELSNIYYKAVDSLDGDLSECCIREIMSLCVIEMNDENEVWDALPPEYQRIIQSIMQSKFSVVKRIKIPFIPPPIFMSKYGLNYDTWITNFVISLSTQIINPKPKKIIDIVTTLVERNSQLAQFLLPYVAILAVTEGNESNISILSSEVLLILSSWKNKESKLGFYECLSLYKSKYDKNDEKFTNANNAPIDRTFLVKVSKAIIKLIYHFSVIIRANFKADSSSSGKVAQTQSQLSNYQLGNIQLFLETIPKKDLSLVALNCGDYQKSLMFIEEHLKEMGSDFPNCLNYIQNLYVALGDFDSAAAIGKKRYTRPNSADRIIENISRGNFEESINSFEKMAKNNHELTTYRCMVEVYLAIDQPLMATGLIQTCINHKPYWNKNFLDQKMECAWKSCSFNDITPLLDKRMNQNENWRLFLGSILNNITLLNFDNFDEALDKGRLIIANNLDFSSSFNNTYLQNSNLIARLQILNELKEVQELLNALYEDETKSAILIKELSKRWKERFNLLSDSIEIVDPIFQVRKVLLKLIRFHMEKRNFDKSLESLINEEYQNLCIYLSKKELKRNNFGRAKNVIREAISANDSLLLNIQLSQVYAKEKKNSEALNTLDIAIKKYCPLSESLKVKGDFISGKALLKYARLNDDLKTVDKNVNVQFYENAAAVSKTEKNFFYLASYLDMYRNPKDDEIELETIVKYYAKSLEVGTDHIFQSLPRIITIWLDLGIKTPQQCSAESQNSFAIFTSMLESINQMITRLPTKDLYSAFSQLISRMCHDNPRVWELLKEIMAKIIGDLTQQTLWWMMTSHNSKDKTRKLRTKQLFDLVKKRENKNETSKMKLIQEYIVVSDSLVALTNATTPPNTKTALVRNLNYKAFTLFNESNNVNNILIPFHDFLIKRPLTSNLVNIQGILEDVDILASMQKPKKISIRGSDGKIYGIMCKPKDDLRKDAKFMEFTNVVNWYLSKDYESRQRQLHIRMYAIVPLNDDSGILEWVQNLTGLRFVIGAVYEKRGLKQLKSIRRFACAANDPLKKKEEMFTKHLIPMHPAVMSDWFRMVFNTSESWYMARQSYIRTLAVMSIVGYIMGLGDRHGENVSLDSVRGDLVHVDFNCLFNKGEDFEIPEKVPFRLTQNMVEAMGPLGYDGSFRRSCEVTLSLIKAKKQVFLSIMQPFVFDPLVEWKRKNSNKNENYTAVKILENIGHRIDGSARMNKKETDVPLSTESFVNYLLTEATSLENLCQMYIGWAPYL